MSQERKSKELNWEVLSLLVVLALVILGNRDMLVNIMPQDAWFWMNEIVGAGAIILVIVIIVRHIYKKTKRQDSISEKANNSIENPKVNIDLKIDTTDIAKMTKEQTDAINEIIDRLQGKHKG